MRQSRGGNRNILQNSVYANHVSFESTTSAIHPSGSVYNQQSQPHHLYSQKHHGAPPLPPPHQQQQQSYQYYNQNHKATNKTTTDSHFSQQQQQHQQPNQRVSDTQQQLDANGSSTGNNIRYFSTGQKHSNLTFNPETTSTSGLSMQHNEIYNQVKDLIF